MPKSNTQLLLSIYFKANMYLEYSEQKLKSFNWTWQGIRVGVNFRKTLPLKTSDPKIIRTRVYTVTSKGLGENRNSLAVCFCIHENCLDSFYFSDLES